MEPFSFMKDLTYLIDSDRDLSGGHRNGHANGWDWLIAPGAHQHRDRTPLIRPVAYQRSALPQADRQHEPWEQLQEREGLAVSININSGGLLLVMDEQPAVQEVLQLRVPTPIDGIDIPTLAEARWSRRLPLGDGGLHLVGVKYLF